MLTRLMPVLIMSFVTVSGYAAPVCNTLPECQQLKARVDARIQVPQAGLAPQFGDIARNADGSVRYMNQYDAVSYCASQGIHLPSARELAQLSQSMGAAGVSETAKDGYNLISAKNADGKIDNFYFNYAGYSRPTGDLGNNWLWSSSVNSYGSDYAYGLYGSYGDVDYVYHTYLYGAVRCVVGR